MSRVGMMRHASVHSAVMTIFLRFVASTAFRNATASHALIEVRSYVGYSSRTFRSGAMGGLFHPVLTFTVEWTIGSRKPTPVFATATMWFTSRLRSIEAIEFTWSG